MALALPLVIGLALAPLPGGSWSRLGDLRLRWVALLRRDHAPDRRVPDAPPALANARSRRNRPLARFVRAVRGRGCSELQHSRRSADRRRDDLERGGDRVQRRAHARSAVGAPRCRPAFRTEAATARGCPLPTCRGWSIAGASRTGCRSRTSFRAATCLSLSA